MFSNENQKDIFKKLADPGALTNPIAGVTSALLSVSNALQARLSGLAPPPPETPGISLPTTPPEPVYYDYVREVSAMYDSAAIVVTGAASDISDHAGSMVSDMAGTVGRFEAATKINREIQAPGDIMDALGSIGGVASEAIGGLKMMVGELESLIPDQSVLEGMNEDELEQWKNHLSDKLNIWTKKGQALAESLVAERAKQVELDAVLSRFGVSSMLPGWASDPGLQKVVKQCASDDLLDLLPS